MKRTLTLLFVLVLIQTLEAQDCNDLFKQVMDKVKHDRASASSKGFDMACQIRVIMDDGQVHSEKMEVKMQGARYKYTSQSTSLYQDEKALVVVNATDNTIYISKPVATTAQQNQFDQMIKLQDSLINYFNIQSCQREWGTVEKETGYYKMILLPKSKIKDMGVNSIAYWIAVDKMEVRKISIYYGPQAGDGIKEYEMIIKRMSNGLLQPLFEETALSMVMDGAKLRKTYAGYTLIDKRN